MRQTLRLTTLLFLSILLSCSDNSANKSIPESEVNAENLPVKEITIHSSGNTMMEMKYDLSEMRAQAGQKMKITLVNESTDEAMQHNIVFVKAGKAETVAIAGMNAGSENNFIPISEDVIASSTMTKPGETTSFEFTAPIEKGTYEFICTYPGHFMQMKGVFIVE